MLVIGQRDLHGRDEDISIGNGTKDSDIKFEKESGYPLMGAEVSK